MTDENPTLQIKPVTPQVLDPRTIDQFIKNQTYELELKARELDLQQQQDRHGFEFSKAALDTQAQDRKDERIFQRQQRRNTYIMAVIIAIAIACVIVFAMLFNKDQIAMEIIKSIVLILSGGGAGYAIGRHKVQAKSESVDTDA